ncbi:MAG: hypothetical protein C9356_15055 [Oleiphilus sp.]|nr:MAG: hypothetical protein C9356_15055 [Oleiphilus sp.]
MDLLLTILGHLLTLVGAIVAVLGDTYRSGQSGLRRVTRVGWIAAGVATVGIGINIYQSIDDHLTKQVYRDIAIKDIRMGWRMAATPFMLMDWVQQGKKSPRNTEELQRLNTETRLAELAKIDFLQPTPVEQQKKLSLASVVCKSTSQGFRIMERAALHHTEIVSREIPQIIEQMRQSKIFGGLLAAGCGDSWTKEPRPELFAELLQDQAMRHYLDNLATLGKMLGE